ncbi:DUF2306 domain-containing protein [Streptomyces platensis]|uniref:DUF2306 domain-containing protein n=1 Tax=Streptomyces platensis TaxID=58346 RepID=UPI0022589662|nr:DUF2306 domain-containing protein [Streptomyces platensis]MCX4639928.1 DUF2306 domain-containing protein [Streptomyces platensis]
MTATGHGEPPARATAAGDRPTTTEADAHRTTTDSGARRATTDSSARPAATDSSSRPATTDTGARPAATDPNTHPTTKPPSAARRSLRGRLRTAAWLLPLAVVTVLVTARALTAYVPPDLHTSRVPLRGELHYALLVAHIATATVAVLTGLAQSWPWLRRRSPAAHRWTGRAYFFAGAFPSALVGIPVIVLTPLGLSNQASLAVLDALWLLTGIAGYRAARQRRYADHRVWMIRNYALTLVAVTSRLIQPLFEYLVAAQLTDPVSYAGDALAAGHDIAGATAWTALVLQLIAAECLLRRRAGKAARRRATRTAPPHRAQPSAPTPVTSDVSA